MLTDTLIVAVAELPARSVPVTVIELDTELSRTLQENVEPVTVAEPPLQSTPPTPDRASVTEPDTATYGVLTVPPFVGLVMLMDGGVRSRFTTALVEAEFVAVSTALPLTTWFAPSELTLLGDVQDWIGAPPGTQENVTVTVELFHPLPSGDGEMEPEIPGSATSATFATKTFCAPASEVWKAVDG
jgi:hypothetical protein